MILINASYIYNQAVVYVYSSYFYFGGSGAESIIARLDGTTYQLSKIGQLNVGRNGHNAIHLNGRFVIVGGNGTRNIEKCEYKNDQMVCQSQLPILTDYAYYPELMTVADDFCDWA